MRIGFSRGAERAYTRETLSAVMHQYRIHRVSNLHLGWYNIDAGAGCSARAKIFKNDLRQ